MESIICNAVLVSHCQVVVDVKVSVKLEMLIKVEGISVQRISYALNIMLFCPYPL